eukprot:13978672-Alexandrium_andersonii.AAC.1
MRGGGPPVRPWHDDKLPDGKLLRGAYRPPLSLLWAPRCDPVGAVVPLGTPLHSRRSGGGKLEGERSQTQDACVLGQPQ